MNYGLAPRPELGPEETAAILVAVTELLQRPGDAAALAGATPAWRFSGRWFNAGPFSLRRPHHKN